MMGYYYGDWIGYGFGGFFMIVFFLCIAFGIIMMMRGGWYGSHHDHGSHNDHKGGRTGDAMEILKQRYAKGEISKEEFKEMKKNIEQ